MHHSRRSEWVICDWIALADNLLAASAGALLTERWRTCETWWTAAAASVALIKMPPKLMGTAPSVLEPVSAMHALAHVIFASAVVHHTRPP